MRGGLVGWFSRLVDVVLRRARQTSDPLPYPPLRPAPPVLVSVSAAPASEQAVERSDGPPALTWGEAWVLAWRGELLEAPAVPAPPPPPLPPRPRRSKTWLFSVLLAELQAGVLLGAVYEVVQT